jgi:hypothetical protein
MEKKIKIFLLAIEYKLAKPEVFTETKVDKIFSTISFDSQLNITGISESDVFRP